MALKIGIIGLPNVGKSTLFNAITKAAAEVSNYPFTTIDPNIGVVEVPDSRLSEITAILGSAKAVPAVIEFVDIAGLVRGASKGEGLGNKFLGHIREVDAVVQVVRSFGGHQITHVDGEPDPVRDIETINAELLLSDIETLEKRIAERESAVKSGSKTARREAEILTKLKEEAGKGKLISSFDTTEEEKALIKSVFLLTSKPQIIAANVDDGALTDGGGRLLEKAVEYGRTGRIRVVPVCAKLESELAELGKEEAEAYLKETGAGGSSLPQLIRAAYETLGLVTFFTGNEKESRAWEVPEGTPLPKAAGKVHTDMEKGFISAEVINYEELKTVKNLQKAREDGKVRLEGKTYIVKDGDLVKIRFNV